MDKKMLFLGKQLMILTMNMALFWCHLKLFLIKEMYI